MPLKKFVLRDPKTRVICVSEFRDRVVHHALVNILQPVFQPRFIYDSFASQKGKGTLLALKRFDKFVQKLTKNGRQVLNAQNGNNVEGYVLKADIKRYFDNVNHSVLLNIIKRHVKDERLIWLCKVILRNYNSRISGKGMPLGNWTSQFFANVYLNELDQFVKHKLKAKYYIRYVDDFVIIHKTKTKLKEYKEKIKDFMDGLKLELHPHKCKITALSSGLSLLGFRVFYYYKLVRSKNIRKINTKLTELLNDYKTFKISAGEILEVLAGWNAYAMHGNTYHLRERLTDKLTSKLGFQERIV